MLAGGAVGMIRTEPWPWSSCCCCVADADGKGEGEGGSNEMKERNHAKIQSIAGGKHWYSILSHGAFTGSTPE